MILLLGSDAYSPFRMDAIKDAIAKLNNRHGHAIGDFAECRVAHWFCPNFIRCVNRDTELPWDQHQLLALVAPRLLCVASATDDAWAGPEGEFEACRLASPAWEAHGLKGLVADGFPPPEKPLQDGSISYHLRTGGHGLTPYDWKTYMDFAVRHGW